MQVIINTDHHTTMTEESIGVMGLHVESSLAHFDSHLTRVEVHLSNESAGRSTGDDIQCRIEARPEGRNPEFVTDNASSVDSAVSGALKKMTHVLESAFGKLDQHKGATSMGGAETR